MVSTRGPDLWLLPLRGPLRAGGHVVERRRLVAGDTVVLADGVSLGVVDVRPPRRALQLQIGDHPPRVVRGVVSLILDDAPQLVQGWRPTAASRVWPDGRGWLRSSPEGAVPVTAACQWTVGGVVVRAILDEVDDVSNTLGGFDADPSLSVVARYDSVHVHMGQSASVVLTGRSARLVSELVIAGGPVPWREVADALWPELDVSVLRRRWDVELARLRRTLRSRSIRANWVRADGSGLVELALRPGDEVRDET